MLIAFVFVLLIIWLGILASLYSIFIPFFHDLWNITAFNTAYYWAIWASERGLLITKYQKPWFIGSWGRDGAHTIGPQSDYKNNTLWRLEQEANKTTRTISSRTKQIPNTWNGNIEYLLAGTGSENFNSLNYNRLENFILSIDTTSLPEAFYTGDSNTIIYTWIEITAQLRLPQKIVSKFNNSNLALLCDETNRPIDCDPDKDNLHNDTIVSRTLQWINSQTNFKILPRTKVIYNTKPAKINDWRDTNIRESDINYIQNSLWSNLLELSSPHNFNPLTTRTPYLISWHNMISQKNNQLKNTNFTSLISTSNNVKLQLWLINLLQSRSWLVYPFLEYKIKSDQNISDIFYTIDWNSRVNEYDVHIIIKKPTSNINIAGNFTIIF